MKVNAEYFQAPLRFYSKLTTKASEDGMSVRRWPEASVKCSMNPTPTSSVIMCDTNQINIKQFPGKVKSHVRQSDPTGHWTEYRQELLKPWESVIETKTRGTMWDCWRYFFASAASARTILPGRNQENSAEHSGHGSDGGAQLGKIVRESGQRTVIQLGHPFLWFTIPPVSSFASFLNLINFQGAYVTIVGKTTSDASWGSHCRS